MSKHLIRKCVVYTVAGAGLVATAAALAAASGAAGNSSSLAGIATNVTGNLGAVAKLITAGAYVAGLAFAVGAIVKFKAHKDNPTQIPIGMPIALLFVAAALIFVPSVFKSSGSTLFGSGAYVAGVSGIQSFGGTKIGS